MNLTLGRPPQCETFLQTHRKTLSNKMFAVPGWSLSADKLKTETAASPAAAAGVVASITQPSRKRKRPNKCPSEVVTRDNVADLWEKIIEHKEPSSSSAKGPSAPRDGGGKKRQKVNKADDCGKAGRTAKAQTQPAPSSQEPRAAREPAAAVSVKVGDEPEKTAEKKKDKKKKKKKDGRDGEEAKDGKAGAKKPAAAAAEQQQQPASTPAPAPPPAAPPKLTPLQASMRAKLVSARFRHLNETLYTRPSAEALALFGESPDMFAEYHEGFRQQVGVWPENPVDGYVADIRARAAVRPPPPRQSSSSFRGGGGRHRQKQRRDEEASEAAAAVAAAAAGGGMEPLPRTAGECTVADLGCGDGRLGGELQGPTAERLRLKVLSFDLQSPAPHVVKADVAALPLADGSVNVAIFCLALMGTNWPAFVEEAYRVLHWKGELWVAEIKSRFPPLGGARRKEGGGVVHHSVGNRRKKTAAAAAAGKKAQAAADEAHAAAAAEALAVEVDGAAADDDKTDVSAFVDVLARRGFVLHGAIDMSNKMFVKMRFLKAAVPTVGKGVPPKDKQQQQSSARPGGPPPKKRFIDATEPVDPADEAKVLKPCVYKIR